VIAAGTRYDGAVAEPRVLIKKLRPDAVVPKYMTPGAAGMDLCAAIDKHVEIRPGERKTIGTGIALAIPPGYEGQVRPRSGLAREYGITMVNSPGTIDHDFRGELCVVLINHGQSIMTISPRDRIAQLVIAPVAQADVEEVEELPETVRGTGGFGSTGK
jgi:dUTP pyrophosphatase